MSETDEISILTATIVRVKLSLMTTMVRKQTSGLSACLRMKCYREVRSHIYKAVSTILTCYYTELNEPGKPFEGKDSIQVLLAIRDGVYHFPRERWSHISSEARNFVESLICVDVEKRLSASEALAHPWIVSCGLGRSHAIQNERPISRISRGVQEETGDAMEI